MLKPFERLVEKWRFESKWKNNDNLYTMLADELEECIQNTLTGKRFTRVSLDKELRADSDGRPVFRKCFDHEILLVFYDDSGAYGFEEWWNEVGAVLFYEWLKDNDKYRGECDLQ